MTVSAPIATSDAHVGSLRAAGLDGRSILDLCQVVFVHFNS